MQLIINPATLGDGAALLAGLDLIPLSGAVIDHAADVGETMLRSLDAIHLASALTIQADLTAFVACDHRLAERRQPPASSCWCPASDQAAARDTPPWPRKEIQSSCSASPMRIPSGPRRKQSR